ncbi:MAG: Helix-turn-helix domain [Schlesneria sp.]|nr:Helix-turn-helix domain [Schlesneria sp.]
MIPNITVNEAAKILNVCDKTVRAWMKSGKLQAVKVGGHYRTTQDWIEASLLPAAVPRPDSRAGQAAAQNDGDAILKRLEARFNFKVPCPKLRKSRH